MASSRPDPTLRRRLPASEGPIDYARLWTARMAKGSAAAGNSEIVRNSHMTACTTPETERGIPEPGDIRDHSSEGGAKRL